MSHQPLRPGIRQPDCAQSPQTDEEYARRLQDEEDAAARAGADRGETRPAAPPTTADMSDEQLARMMQQAELESAMAEPLRQGPDEEAGETRYVVSDPVWGELHRDQAHPGPGRMAVINCLPCCVGGACSPPRKAAWKRVVRTIAFVTLVIDCILVIVSLFPNGFAPTDDNSMLGPYPDTLSAMGAKNVYKIQHGQLWRLLLPAFLHAGFVHLLFNGLVQFRLGVYLEFAWGWRRWSAIYVVSTLASSLLSCVSLPDQIGVGASGAIMGLLGAHFVDLILSWGRGDEAEQRQRTSQFMLMAVNIAIVLSFSFVPLVDWAAHLGGLLGGMVMGGALFSAHLPQGRRRTTLRRILPALLAVSLVVLLFVTLFALDPNPELGDLCAVVRRSDPSHVCW
mmetsp:Transcript_22308/g.71821  ORF Transcript_22308/g.71821 Transcript_22308/m.71821 type:complete len:395 (+) Transcript_22308:32-1216(+)